MASNGNVSVLIYLRYRPEPLRVVIADSAYESFLAEFTTKDDTEYEEIGCYKCALTVNDEPQSLLMIRIEEIQAIIALI